MANDSVQLLYQHPHITIYLEDNTIRYEESSEENDTSLYGIQVGQFEGGRDNVVLRYTNTDQQLSELGEPDFEKYGQAGYNAYNALESGSCNMYIERVTSDDFAYANAVIMAKFKMLGVEQDPEEPTINHVDDRVELVPNLTGFTDLGSNDYGKFDFYGKVTSGLTGDAEIDGLFGHITSDWLADKPDLPKFTLGVVRFHVPQGVTPTGNVKITQTSRALKSFYADYGEDASHITASGALATKTKEYPAESLLPTGTTTFDLSFLVQENDSVSITIDWDGGTTVINYTFSTTNVTFEEVATIMEEGDAPEEPEVTKPVLDVSYYIRSFEDIPEVDDLQIKFAELCEESIDADGYYHMPLVLIYALGRGLYGNDIRVRFTDAMDYDFGDQHNDFRRYCITVMQNTKEGLKTREYLRGSIDWVAWDTSGTTSLSAYLEDLTNDQDYGSQKININLCEQTLDKMLELYNTYVAADNPLTLSKFDPIFGLSMNGEPDENILVSNYEGDEEAVNLESITGFALRNGSDGAMTYKPKMTVEERDAYNKALERTLMLAFAPLETVVTQNGKDHVVTVPIHDRTLRSRHTTPADFMFDANFPDTVKAKMVEFASVRKYDCMTYLDSGLCTTTTECINWLKSTSDLYGYNVVKELHCYKYRDSRFTRKTIPMTITHYLAKNLPTHLKVYGIGVPFARKYARMHATKDYVAGSFLPLIDPEDHDIKEEIYKYGGNCWESLNRTTVQRSTAETTCREKSDRKWESNQYIINRAVNLAYAIMGDHLVVDDIDEEKILSYTERAEKEIGFQLFGLITRCKIAMESTKADRQKEILRLKMNLEFKSHVKYGAVEIYLDPRGTAAEEAAALAALYT